MERDWDSDGLLYSGPEFVEYNPRISQHQLILGDVYRHRTTASEAWEKVAPLVSRLDPYSQDLVRCILHGWKQWEIADLLGISAPSVCVRWKRTVDTLALLPLIPQATPAEMTAVLDRYSINTHYRASKANTHIGYWYCCPVQTLVSEFLGINQSTLYCNIKRTAEQVGDLGDISHEPLLQGFLVVKEHANLLANGLKTGGKFRGLCGHKPLQLHVFGRTW